MTQKLLNIEGSVCISLQLDFLEHHRTSKCRLSRLGKVCIKVFVRFLLKTKQPFCINTNTKIFFSTLLSQNCIVQNKNAGMPEYRKKLVRHR
jgi:hypothetical protein